MNKRSKHRSPPHHPTVANPPAPPSSLLPLLMSGRLAAVIAIIVASVLIPSEGTIVVGSHVPIGMLLAMLTLAIALLSTQETEFSWRLEPAEWLAAGLIGWHSLSAVVATFYGNGRSALNALWVWIGYGLIAFLLRRLITHERQQRAVIAVLIALGTMLSVHGYYQYFVSFPQMRAEFAAEREKLTAGTAQQFAEGTPEYELLGARVRSPEPLATFALTNSLAGYLAPWLVAALAIGISRINLRNGNLLGLVIIAGLLAGCLLLTHSRAGVLAALCGSAVLVAGLIWQQGNVNRRWVALAGIVAVTLLGLFAWGCLNEDLWRGAPLSVRYRLEYWHATLRMIGDYPLLGCGPGNFQDYYTRYKLPQASETIADPHNFLLEIAATAGLPALLFGLAALGITWLAPDATFFPSFSGTAQAVRSNRELPFPHNGTRPEGLRPSAKNVDTTDIRPVYLGALAGLFIAVPLSILVGLGPEMIPRQFGLPVYWLLGLPCGIAALFALQPWVADGAWNKRDGLAVLVALLVNLLAAGSTIFPGVFLTAWILSAFALPISRPLQEQNGNQPWLAWCATSAAAVLALACYLTSYRPVLDANLRINQGLAFNSLGRNQNAAEELLHATQADPWSVDARRGLAEVRLQSWVLQPTERNEQAFVQAADDYLRRSPQSYRAAMLVGNWRLQLYRWSGRDSWLEEAVRAYEQGVRLYPQSAFLHAQLAWVHSLRKDEPAARREAAEALRLDDLNPHREQKLTARHLEDVDPAQTKTPQPLPQKTAREIVEQLTKP